MVQERCGRAAAGALREDPEACAYARQVAGALAGGVYGYYSTMSERYKDQETMARAINADLAAIRLLKVAGIWRPGL